MARPRREVREWKRMRCVECSLSVVLPRVAVGKMKCGRCGTVQKIAPNGNDSMNASRQNDADIRAS